MAHVLYRGRLDEDLRPLSALLWQQRIMHRVVEEDGKQVVVLAQAADATHADSLLRRWQRGELTIRLREAPAPATGTRSIGAGIAAYPVTVVLLVLSFLGFLLLYLGAPVSWVALLTYQPFVLEEGRPVFSEAPGQLWRLLTPVFLHFGWMHIVFNSLWCWELGRRIEAALGSFNLGALFLATAMLSNYAQHLSTGPSLFGGLSGVVYGFLGFAWVAGRLNPRWRAIAPATSVMLFMVGWLLFCMFGLVNVLGFSVANAAHLGGLLSGALIGAVFGAAYRRAR